MTQPPTENKPDFPHDDPLVVPQTERDIAQQTDKHAETTRDPLEVVLSEFSDALQRGTEPSIADYAARYPDLVDQIRELFPLLQGLGQWKEDREIECMRRNFPREISIKRLGDYQLERELGRGGMGIVFQAVHITSQRTVAIKLLPWRFAAEMAAWKGRLQHEAATIAALHHPNIVPIYSFAEDQGYSFYVMQLIDGIGLDRMIEQLSNSEKKPPGVSVASPSPNISRLTLIPGEDSRGSVSRSRWHWLTPTNTTSATTISNPQTCWSEPIGRWS